jgi:hypothetical protein
MAQTENKRKRSSTRDRQNSYYPTPQNLTRLEKATMHADGTKKDHGVSKNEIINRALDYFFKQGLAAAL